MAIGFGRVSIFCRDMAGSLAFYRDRLGLAVVEDKTIEGAAAGALLQLPPCRMRIVLLAPEADAPVMLGLFEIGGLELDRIQPPSQSVAHGQTALVLTTTQFDRLHAELQSAGVKFLTPPVRYPKRQASERSPAGLYREMIVYDPDGVLVSVMQIDPLPEQAH
jgi:catechol 2,3-dioxygenase-like lactoylglutathione lyase family enzyme